jgi:hypothetical protein
MKYIPLKICLLVVALLGGVAVASDLPKCPSDKNVLWHNCFGTETRLFGSKYVGEWKHGKWHGQGTETLRIFGANYVGEFKDGKRDGQGTLIYAGGTSDYVGEFKDGSPNGQGTLTTRPSWASPRSSVEEGIFKDNKFQYAKKPTTTTVGTCLTKASLCSNTFLCKLAAPDVPNGKKAWFSSSSDYYKYVVEAKKRGLSCGVDSSSSLPAVETKMPRTGIEPAPVAPKKKPETTTESTPALIDPLHIKKYGNTYHTRLLPNTVFFIGEIEKNDERGFRSALRAHEVDTVVLISPGGLINEGLRIANIINDKSLATYVPVAATCASACSFMFFAGNPKLAHGRLGVHQFYIEDDKKKMAVGKVQKITQNQIAEIIENLEAFDTPSSVYPKMLSTSGMYFFSEEEKSDFNNNQINSKLISKINKVLLYFLKSLDDDLDDSALNSMPMNMKNNLTQLELVRIGCMKGPIDGIKGEATSSAIKLLSSKIGSDISARKFSDLFRVLNHTKEGACY